MKRKKFDVVVVGGAGIDTNVYLYGTDIDFNVEANFAENLDYVGQTGGYAARGFAQLGKRTALIDYVGDDYQGKFIRREMKKDGVNIDAFFIDPAGTRRSVNFMYKDGRRKNFYDGKGSMMIMPEVKACRTILSQTLLAHFSIINWTRHLLPLARQLGITIACDLQDVVSVDDPYRRDYIEYADILLFSSVNYQDPVPLIRRFLESKPERIVIVGLGGKGCALGMCNGVQFFGAVDLPGLVVDTNGAGDALAVGFLASYCIDGYSLEDSVVRGQIAARHACTLKGTSSNLITKESLDTYFNPLKRNAAH